MSTFVDLIKSSVITQFFLTAIVLITTCALVVQQQAVPQQLWDIDFAVVAFYMGSKVGLAQGRASLPPSQ